MAREVTGKDRRVRVLIVDDSAMIRKLLSIGLATDPLIDVIGAASSAEQARQMIDELAPDVMTLDIEMPRMDGVTFLRQLMPEIRLPTVVISSTTKQGATVTLAALEAGAVDVIAKPAIGVGEGLAEIMADVCHRVRAAAGAKPGAGNQKAVSTMAGRSPAGAPVLVVIGASTGGVQALAQVLQQLPHDFPGTVIVQHMPEGFTAAFANRLDGTCAVQVREACDGDAITPGVVLIAPGGTRHLSVLGRAPHWRVALNEGPAVSFSRPSVDVLFESAARQAGPACVAALLTGMGRDGAKGLLSLRQSGATTMVQDEASSVVWGMPGAAFELGATDTVIPLDSIAPTLVAAARALASRAPTSHRNLL